MSRSSRLQPVLALAALALTLLPTAGQEARPKPRRFAVLTGVNRYEHADLKTLKYAENDVVALAKLLRENGYEVVLLTGPEGARDAKRQPTRVNIEARIKEVLRKCRRGDTVLLAFAGHGLQFEGRKDAFFCPSDARPFKDETDTLVSLAKVYAEMKKSFAAVKLLFVDACRDDPKAARGGRSGVDGDSAPRPPSGVGALFSCSAGQRAYEDDGLKHGVFFHFVLQGLKGKAKDPDDGDVTFEGLATYVKKQVTRDVPKRIGGGARQAPTLNAGELSGEPAVLLTINVAEQETKAVLARALEAIGGTERLSKVNAFTCKVKGTLHPAGQISVTMQLSSQGRDKRRNEVELHVLDGYRAVTVLNGDQGWTKTMDGKIKKLDEKARAASRAELGDLGFLAPALILKGSKFEKAGEETVDGREAVILKFTGPDGNAGKLFFDKKTGLPFKCARKARNADGKEVNFEITLGDYKDFDGIKQPAKTEIKADGKKYFDFEVVEFKILDKLDPKLFAELK
jgi:hypothetical protein